MPFIIPKDEFADANYQVTIRFTDQIHAELKAASVKHKISINRLVLMCCRYALDNMEFSEPEPNKPSEQP